MDDAIRAAQTIRETAERAVRGVTSAKPPRLGTVTAANADGTLSVVPDGSTEPITAVKCCEAPVGSRVAMLAAGTERLAVARIGGILDLVYPVGHVYTSFDPTSPAQLFGGTWTPITGRFLYANASTATGGENAHALTEAETAVHRHIGLFAMSDGTKTTAFKGYGTYSADGLWGIVNTGGATGDIQRTGDAGGGQPHNNMPAYQSVYAWRRTS